MDRYGMEPSSADGAIHQNPLLWNIYDHISTIHKSDLINNL